MLALLASGDAHGRPARGALARAHPTQLRRESPHRRARPREPRRRFERETFLRPLRRAGAGRATRRRAGRQAAALLGAGLPARRRTATKSLRASGGSEPLRFSGRRCARITCSAGVNFRAVHAARSGSILAEAPASSPAGFVPLVHGPERRGQSTTAEILTVKLLEHRSAGDGAGRRRGALAPLEGARLQQGRPRHETSAASATSPPKSRGTAAA